MGYGNGGGTSVGGGRDYDKNIAAQEESQSKIRDVFSAQEQQLTELHVVLDMLEKRLDTVLTPNGPTATGSDNNAPPVPMSSHLHLRAIEHARGIGFAIQRLRDITRRVEV